MLKHAPKIFKEDCVIDWNKSSKTILNLIRGLSPTPCAFTYLDDKMLKIYSAHTENETIDGNLIETDNKKYLKFKCADDYIYIDELQLEGKKKMDIKAFLNGYKIKECV